MRHLSLWRLGSLVQANAQPLVLFLSLALLVLCATLGSVKFDPQLSSWIQRTARVDSELLAINSAIGDGAGSDSMLVLQVPQESQLEDPGVLSVESLMVHLEALALAKQVTVDLHNVIWTLKDICFSPTPPDYEDLLVNQMLEHLIPCAIKTPLDCFWEGSKLLGPEQDVRMSSVGPTLKWTSLNPLLMIEAKHRFFKHASFPYASLTDWMLRVGITTGYQERPCLDPTDVNCPFTAPNKHSGQPPNVAAELADGCYGVATKQMHWKEEELMGGVIRNKTGHITHASAIQSSIQLMGERDIYDYWRKTSKVQDIDNWSPEKARLVLSAWQAKYNEDLAKFSKSNIASSSFKLFSMTPKSMLEPIRVNSITESKVFELSIALMTLFMCAAFPSFRQKSRIEEKDSSKSSTEGDICNHISKFKMILLATLTSAIVALTFTASLGISSFVDMPFNLATTQILPPLALYYGVRQALLVANIYSQNFQHSALFDLTSRCLIEIVPIISRELVITIVPLATVALIPVPATRILIRQAIVYIILASFTTTLLIPSLFTAFIIYHFSEHAADNSTTHEKNTLRSHSRKTSYNGKKCATIHPSDESLEEQIFLRIQDDLKNIKADCGQTTDINFSAHLEGKGLEASFKLTTCQQPDNKSTSHQQPTPDINIESKPCDPIMQLPDLVLWPNNLTSSSAKEPNTSHIIPSVQENEKDAIQYKSKAESEKKQVIDGDTTLFTVYLNAVTSNRLVQSIVCLVKLIILVAITTQWSKVKYGLPFRDIVPMTPEYESLLMQDRCFPIYNIHAITRGNFDYPANQRLLHEYHQRILQVNGVVKGDESVKPKFWLVYFRDWLIELQEKFDIERNKSTISNEGWTAEASDASKLAYKLLAQTGKLDGPIDRNQVETNRLVDRAGIINQKAFYYYLTAWVMNDAFSYSNSEADFRPAPKIWYDNPDDLRIERARPLTYTQIPFLIKLSAQDDSMKTITEIRGISQAFEQLNFPNFPAGLPFMFWDQFFNLDLLFVATLFLITALLCLIGIASSGLIVTLVIVGPLVITTLEMYGLLGCLGIPFNNIVAVLMIGFIGSTTVQTIYLTTYFENCFTERRTYRSLKKRTRVVLTSSICSFLSVVVLRISNINLICKYSNLLLYSSAMSGFNSLLLGPVLLSALDKTYVTEPENPRESFHDTVKKSHARREKKTEHRIGKRRSYPRVQSEISLSTISEEPQSDARLHDFKFDLSIRCY